MAWTSGAQWIPARVWTSCSRSRRSAKVAASTRPERTVTTGAPSGAGGERSSSPPTEERASRRRALRAVSRARTFASPSRARKRHPARRPARPGAFPVPASSRSGIVDGISRRLESPPVPPTQKGATSIPSRTHTPPVPWGPSRPLCPVKATTSAPSAAGSTSTWPAAWAASAITTASAAWASRASGPSGVREPSTLDATLTTSAAAPSSKRAASSRSTPPEGSPEIVLTSTPRLWAR